MPIRRPLLPDPAPSNVGRTSIRARRRWHKIYDYFLAKKTVKGARVAESLDYEPVQTKLYFERLRARRAVRHLYGCDTT